MKIAIIGSGGREHAICEKLNTSKKKLNIFCIPGNAGTSLLAKNINLDYSNFKKLYVFLNNEGIKTVIVGPEEPLVNGIVDFLSNKGIKIFGPNKYASKLEGSKSFMKKICQENNIPTARYMVCKNFNHIKKFLKTVSYPIVVKADGLAAGKGVLICKTKNEVLNFSRKIFGGKFQSSTKLVLEEYLKGEELSYFVVVDKNSHKFVGSAQDHKKIGEGETGLNTGGMGAYSPAPILNEILKEKIERKIIIPTLKALKKKGSPYKGFLYAGLMICKGNPYLIEYNVRMGDPECQVILPRIKNDLINIINASIEDRLKSLKISWSKKKCMTIVLCSKGYPLKYKKNVLIPNLLKLKHDKSFKIYHAGTKILNDEVYAIGGRVLNINNIGKNFRLIRNKILSLIHKINWKKGYYRKDIGWRIIRKK